MLTPDVTYQYAQAKDIAGGTLVIVNKKQTLQELELSMSIDLFIVPADKVFILSAATAVATPNGAGLALSLGMSVRFENTTHEFHRNQNTFEANNDEAVVRNSNWSGQLWVPPSSELRCSATFNNDGNGNTLRFSVHGILIPRGNVQQG